MSTRRGPGVFQGPDRRGFCKLKPRRSSHAILSLRAAATGSNLPLMAKARPVRPRLFLETPLLERPLTLAGVNTRCLLNTELEPEAPLLLCLHGWRDSADAFRPLMAAINGDCAMMALDLPGFGAADRLKPGAHLPQFVEFCGAAIRQFGPGRRLLVVGQSLGARASLTAVHLTPAIAPDAIIAIGPAPLELPAWQKMIVRNPGLAPSVSRIGADQDPLDQVQEMVRSHRRTCFHGSEHIPEFVFEDYARWIRPEDAAVHIDRLRQFGAELGEPLQLHGVTCPVDLIWGRQDRIAPYAGHQHYLEAVPHAALTTIEACGHHAHIEHPLAVADVIRRRLFAC